MYQMTDKFNQVILGDSRKFHSRIICQDRTVENAIVSIKQFSKVLDNNFFSIGGAISKYVQLELWNPGFQIEGAESVIEIGLETEDNIEWCPLGKYTAQKPSKSSDGLIRVTLYDDIQSKMSGAYFSELSYPTDAKNVLYEISAKTGVPIDVDLLEDGIVIDKRIAYTDTSFDENGDPVSTDEKTNPFDGYLYREALGYIAMLYCKYAHVNRDGIISFIWYEDDGYDIRPSRYYDDFESSEKVFISTKIVCNTGNEVLESGDGFGNVQLENPVMTQERLDFIFNKVKTLQFIPAKVSFLGDIRVDCGDVISVYRPDGSVYKIPIMDITHEYDGGLKTSIQSFGGNDQENVAGPTLNKLERVYTDLFLVKELIGNKANFDDLFAVNASFKNLTADYGEFREVVVNDLAAFGAVIENLKATNITTENLNAALANIDVLTATTADIRYVKTEELSADVIESGFASIKELQAVDGKFKNLSTEYLNVTFSNIDTANIDKAVIATMFVELGLIDTAVIENGHITGYLDSVAINANAIRAGTLSVDRLIINGSEESIIYALNNAGELTSTSVDTLDGGILTDRTITADKLVAHSITANEITTSNIIGANGWINLAEGTFNYGNQLIWDGYDLYISAETITMVTDGRYATQTYVDNMQIGARNLIRNAKTLIFEDYYFGDTNTYLTDENGDRLLDENGDYLIA